jgi:hypothetical protein
MRIYAYIASFLLLIFVVTAGAAQQSIKQKRAELENHKAFIARMEQVLALAKATQRLAKEQAAIDRLEAERISERSVRAAEIGIALGKEDIFPDDNPMFYAKFFAALASAKLRSESMEKLQNAEQRELEVMFGEDSKKINELAAKIKQYRQTNIAPLEKYFKNLSTRQVKGTNRKPQGSEEGPLNRLEKRPRPGNSPKPGPSKPAPEPKPTPDPGPRAPRPA